MLQADIETLERATVDAVAPSEVIEAPDWLIPFDQATVGRAKSAVPLKHDVGPGRLEEICQAYRERQLSPAFRIADVDGLDGCRTALAGMGLSATKPTWVEVAATPDVALSAQHDVPILERPDGGWGEVFVGEGFDPVDGAMRVALLTRSPDALYAAVSESGRTVAVGAISFGRGWAGVHGMRTVPDRRGCGYASRILGHFGRLAQARGIERMFLQVEEPNPARRIYRKAGFKPVWRYRYWVTS